MEICMNHYKIFSVLFFFLFSITPNTTQAASSSVLFEVAELGIDDGNPDSPFGLPLNSELLSGGNYKLKIVGRDVDSDFNNQPVNNITFALEITNGMINRFQWKVTGNIDDNDFTNEIVGVDNFGQVSTDTFFGHTISTQALINTGFAEPTEVAVVYFTVGAAGIPLVINFDSNPYISGVSTANSHYAVNGVLYNLNQGDGFSYSSAVTTPLIITSLQETNDPFSPNGDRYKDTTTIYGYFNRTANWQLVIKNSKGTIVRNFSGRGARISVIWDGKNTKRVVVPNGTYTYTLTGTDASGNSTFAKNTVKVGTTLNSTAKKKLR